MDVARHTLLGIFGGLVTGALFLGGAVACGKADDESARSPESISTGDASGAASTPRQFKVDPAHSYLMFRATHFGASHNYGRFNEFGGTIVADESNPAGSGVELTVRVESVDTGIEKRDNHLRSPDFFDVKSHPEIKFKSTKVARDADGTWQVTGDLTLHGVTKSIVVAMRKVGEGKSPAGPVVGFEGSFDIRRSDYEMSNMIGPVGDEIRILIVIEGAEQK